MKESLKQKQLNRMRDLIGFTDEYGENIDDLLLQLLDDAEQTALSYMHRTALPDNLATSVGDAALVAYNRMGTEGENSRSEAGESYSFIELPEKFYGLWKSYRLARVSGNAYEGEKS